MTDPTPFQKLLILGGKKAGPEQKDWLRSVLDDDDARRRGFVLAVPNSVGLVFFGLVWIIIGDTSFAMIMFVAAVGFMLIGAFVPSWSAYLARSLVRRNGL
ncbi:MAG: hypothetical protein ACC652_05140 [Acidimicrobiales bacterium]